MKLITWTAGIANLLLGNVAVALVCFGVAGSLVVLGMARDEDEDEDADEEE